MDRRMSTSFSRVKELYAKSSLLSKPLEGKILYMYVSTLDEAVSFVLVRLETGGQQKPVYYTSKILHEAEARYPKM